MEVYEVLEGIDGRCWIVHQRDDGIAEFVVVAVLLGEKGLHLVVKCDVIARFRVGCRALPMVAI